MKRFSARTVAVAAGILALSGPAAAQPTQAQIGAFVAAMEDVGCVITDAHDDKAAAIEAATGLDDNTLAEIVGILLERGVLVVPDPETGGLRLTIGRCA